MDTKDLIERLRFLASGQDDVHSMSLTEAADALEAMSKDAQRYRWLRDNPWPPELEAVVRLHQNLRWDAAIDAAIAKDAP